MFLLFESCDICWMCSAVGREVMEVRLQSDAWQQQEKAHRAKLSKRVLSCFCYNTKQSISSVMLVCSESKHITSLIIQIVTLALIVYWRKVI